MEVRPSGLDLKMTLYIAQEALGALAILRMIGDACRSVGARGHRLVVSSPPSIQQACWGGSTTP